MAAQRASWRGGVVRRQHAARRPRVTRPWLARLLAGSAASSGSATAAFASVSAPNASDQNPTAMGRWCLQMLS